VEQIRDAVIEVTANFSTPKRICDRVRLKEARTATKVILWDVTRFFCVVCCVCCVVCVLCVCVVWYHTIRLTHLHRLKGIDELLLDLRPQRLGNVRA
jgi:hypothetical protein